MRKGFDRPPQVSVDPGASGEELSRAIVEAFLGRDIRPEGKGERADFQSAFSRRSRGVLMRMTVFIREEPGFEMLQRMLHGPLDAKTRKDYRSQVDGESVTVYTVTAPLGQMIDWGRHGYDIESMIIRASAGTIRPGDLDEMLFCNLWRAQE